jgi:predicted ArsR family transcriptional regulator
MAMVTATPVSAAEVAAATGIAHAAASYHLRRLAGAGLVRPVDTQLPPGQKGRPRQSYRMREEAIRDLDQDPSRLLTRGLLAELGRRLQAAGTNTTTIDAEVWLTQDDWRRVTDLVQEASAIVHEQALPPNTPAGKRVGFTALLLDLT